MENELLQDLEKQERNRKIHLAKLKKNKILNNSYKEGGYKESDDEEVLSNPVPVNVRKDRDVDVVRLVESLYDNEEMKDYFTMFPELVDSEMASSCFYKVKKNAWVYESNSVIFCAMLEILDIKPNKLFRLLDNKIKNLLIKEVDSNYNIF